MTELEDTMPERSPQYVSCETVAAISVHLRHADDAPLRFGGHSQPQPRTLCGFYAAWDTRIPVTAITCRACKQIRTREEEK